MKSEIIKIRSQIISGASTARAEVEKALAKFRDNADLHPLTEILPDYALARADEIDRKIQEIRDKNIDNITKIESEVVAQVGELAGVPYVAKDNFLTSAPGSHTTASAKILANFESPIDATAVERLNQAGAILIGKSNLDAFAHGGSTENSAFGPTKNAYDDTRVAGGSSGGSAVVVAKNIVPFALGSDTGGSIREPASFNNVLGLKPTYGLISRYGVVAMASSTDVVGTFTRTAVDADILMKILSGRDGRDGTLLAYGYAELADRTTSDRPLKIGIIKEFMGEGVDEEVRANTEKFAQKLRDQGHVVDEVSLPMVKYALAIYYIVVPAELSSNLARFDGVRYGQRAGVCQKFARISADPNRFATSDSQMISTENDKTEANDPDEMFTNSRNAGFMPENKRRLMIGAFVLSSGYFDAYYLKAQKARTLLIREFDKLFNDYDFLIGPVAPTPAFKLGENVSDPLKMYLSDVMTTPASMAGLPALSLPNGFTKSGLPIGVQIIGPAKSDAKILRFAQNLEDEK